MYILMYGEDFIGPPQKPHGSSEGANEVIAKVYISGESQ